MTVQQPGGFHWGGVRLPDDTAYTHTMIQGRTGSGKTSILATLLENRLSTIEARNGRMVLSDPKRENGALCHAFLPIRVPVWDLNPLSASGVRWMAGMDITTPVDCDHASSVFIPERKGADHNDFFSKSARQCLRSLLIALTLRAPGKWTLADLINLSRLRFLTAVLDLEPGLLDPVAELMSVSKTRLGIAATLASDLAPLEVVAAGYDAATQSVSLRKFLTQIAVLLLGYDDSISGPLMALYPLMVKLLQDWILARNDPTTPVDFVMDEYPLFGKCDLTPIALKGRSAKASLTIAFQDINGLDHLLGKEKCRELCSNLSAKCFLSVDSLEAAKFASETVGEHEVSQFTKTVNVSSQGRSESTAEQIVRRPHALPDEIRDLPMPTWAEGVVRGYFRTPYTGSYQGEVRFRDTMERVVTRSGGFTRYRQRPAAEQLLKPMTEARLLALGFPLTDKFKAALKGAP
ncbi:MAG: type IV secretory system conjugative DNA transfer family protein [Fimbriiglobus sp.]